MDDLREAGAVLPYAMLVTLEDIRIFRWDGAALSEVLHLPTADALSFYDSEFRDKTVYTHKIKPGDCFLQGAEEWLPLCRRLLIPFVCIDFRARVRYSFNTLKLTAQVKLVVTPKQADALKRTMQAANAVCDSISAWAWENQTVGQYPHSS